MEIIINYKWKCAIWELDDKLFNHLSIDDILKIIVNSLHNTNENITSHILSWIQDSNNVNDLFNNNT